MVSTLIDGMSVALYTTLVGSVLNVWLMLNYRLVEERHGPPADRDRRAGRAPWIALTRSTTTTAARSFAT